jgi:predicted CoA-binding protein
MRVRSATRADINDFYHQRRLAVVGVSRDDKAYSRLIFRELRKRGYDVVPVNPSAAELDGVRCYPSLSEVTPAVDGALVLLPTEKASDAVCECAEAGVGRVWLRDDVPGARELCQRGGATLISGYCPFMFLPGTAFVHQCHAFGLKLAGKYPR